MAARQGLQEEHGAIGERLRAVRVKRGLRPEVVAGRLGMSLSNYSRYESGNNKLTYAQIHAFADALGVSLRELVRALSPDIDNELATGKAQETLHFKTSDRRQNGAVDMSLAGASA